MSSTRRRQRLRGHALRRQRRVVGRPDALPGRLPQNESQLGFQRPPILPGACLQLVEHGVPVALEYMPTATQQISLVEGRIDLGFMTGDFRAPTINGAIPAKHSEYADGVSPEISWNMVSGAQSYALIVEDPDAPTRPFEVGPLVFGGLYVHASVYGTPQPLLGQAEPASSGIGPTHSAVTPGTGESLRS